MDSKLAQQFIAYLAGIYGTGMAPQATGTYRDVKMPLFADTQVAEGLAQAFNGLPELPNLGSDLGLGMDQNELIQLLGL